MRFRNTFPPTREVVPLSPVPVYIKLFLVAIILISIVGYIITFMQLVIKKNYTKAYRSIVTVTFGCEQISFQAILILEDDLIP